MESVSEFYAKKCKKIPTNSNDFSFYGDLFLVFFSVYGLQFYVAFFSFHSA